MSRKTMTRTVVVLAVAFTAGLTPHAARAQDGSSPPRSSS
jgi:hypothetical protein